MNNNDNRDPFRKEDQHVEAKKHDGLEGNELQAERLNSQSEDAEYRTIDSSQSAQQDESKSQGPTYYAYGQTPHQQTQSNRGYNSQSGSIESDSMYNTNAAHAGSTHLSSMQPNPVQPNSMQSNSMQGAPAHPFHAASGSQYPPGAVNHGYGYGAGASQSVPNQGGHRPFTTSKVGGDPLSSKKEKTRSSGFGKMFLSFMAGVVIVGLLMYTADVQNWFSTDAVETSSSYQSNREGSSGNGSGSSSSGVTQGTTTSLMMDRPDNISELFKTSSPAVVKIETYSKARRNSNNSLFNDPFFRQFFGNTMPNNQEEQDQLVQSGMGTGFFFESTGYILTNQHVLSDAEEIRVIVEGHDEPYIATKLGSSYELDLAVIKVDSEQPFPTLPLGNSNDTQIGDWVVAIGNPHGFDHTLTVGVISAKERPIDIADTEGTRHYKNLLQTDASINPGNSGGPLLNMNGEVIGINTAVSSTAQGIGFAIPTSTVSEVLSSLKNNETLPADAAPFIGVDLQDLTENIATQLGLKDTKGTLVRNVYYNSPAYQASIKQYDVIVKVNDKAVNKAQDLIDYIGEQKVGDTVELTIIRDGAEMKLNVEVGDKNQFGL